MSSALGLAGVSAVLADLLNNGVVDHDLAAMIGTVKVSAKPPDRVVPGNGADPNQLNLFLYHVAPNSGWRNNGLPSRDAAGNRLTNPPLALDLFYLLTAYGEKDFNAEILLGYAMHLLHETPVLTREAIRKALRGPSAPVTGEILPTDFKTLVATDLAEQVEQIKIIPQSMSSEEMSKLWTALQTSYRPTAAYQVSLVLIEARRPTKQTLPVRERIVFVTPFQLPLIESIESAAGTNEPIAATSTLLIRGQQLRGNITSVVIGGIKFTPTPANLGASEIKIPLPPALPDVLRAGIQSAQVVHEIDMGKPSVPHRGVESNVMAFVLHPKITVPATASGSITVTFDPKVQRSQRVRLLLGERNPPPGGVANTFNIASPPDNGILAPAQTDTATITFPLDGVTTGQQYLVRALVDGAESSLEVDTNELSPTYNQYIGPTVNIT